jgi:hypothetical protein
MARLASDLGVPTNTIWPPAGKIIAGCTAAERYKSPKKGTSGIKVEWITGDLKYCFNDVLFVTPKAVKRLNLIAQRVCGMPDTTELPDDDVQCASFLAKYIMAHIVGKKALITIEENDESYIVENENDPDFGKKKSVTRRRVSFSGYDRPENIPAREPGVDDDIAADINEDDIPF